MLFSGSGLNKVIGDPNLLVLLVCVISIGIVKCRNENVS